MNHPTLAEFATHTSEKLRFADTDRHGHVSNAIFAVCFQNARLELLRARNLPPLGQSVILARIDITFLAELHWPGEVVVGTRIDRIGRASLELAQAMFHGDRCVASATSTCVLIDGSTRRSAPWPPDVVEGLSDLMPAERLPQFAEVTPAQPPAAM